MTALADWLLEQFDEDAKPLEGASRIDPPGCGCTDCITGYSRPGTEADERLLATVEAYRKIVELHYYMPGHESRDFGFGDGNCVTCRAQGPCATFRALAGIYRGRPGWQEDWA